MIEQCSRLVEDQRKLTTRFMDVGDLLTESAYWARNGRSPRSRVVVKREHVQKAIDQRIYRSNQIEERVREMITDGTVMVDTRGAVVGQVNGLSVSSIGDYAFGRPSRITATHRLGDGEVVDIEREVEMGGPIHSKGVLILAGYLGAKYAAERPLSLTARLVFEQSYSGVEGDSASSAELYALLSSLSGVPIQQRFAVTGSVNQRGQIQAIGGVNEKIEGFFDGLPGRRGSRVTRGCSSPRPTCATSCSPTGCATRWPRAASTSIPSPRWTKASASSPGVPAGALTPKGTYPKGSINQLVVERLAALTEKAREAARRKDDATASESPGGSQPAAMTPCARTAGRDALRPAR